MFRAVRLVLGCWSHANTTSATCCSGNSSKGELLLSSGCAHVAPLYAAGQAHTPGDTHGAIPEHCKKLAPTMHVNGDDGDDGGDGGDKGAFVFEVSHCPQVFLSPQHTLRLQCASHLVSNDSGQSARQGSAFSHCSAFSACSCPSTDRVDACFNASPGAIAGSAYA